MSREQNLVKINGIFNKLMGELTDRELASVVNALENNIAAGESVSPEVLTRISYAVVAGMTSGAFFVSVSSILSAKGTEIDPSVFYKKLEEVRSYLLLKGTTGLTGMLRDIHEAVKKAPEGSLIHSLKGSLEEDLKELDKLEERINGLAAAEQAKEHTKH